MLDPRSEVADAIAVVDEADGHLGEVEAALARLDEGSYGRCEVCAAAIPDDQLARAPTRTRCEAHTGG